MMAANPHPSHITAEMWWFIEELERLGGSDTEFSGAWGDWKPGYHCDYWTLVHTPEWSNDYSIQHPDDKVGGTWLENYGAAVDWTFHSAQAGNFTAFKKYGDRVRAAWASRDPRCKGWREVLCQGDSDPQADGYDFTTWTQRTPDASHTWHMHFSCLRKYLATLDVYKAMLSILRGETLAQWLAKGDDDEMPTFFEFPKGSFWFGNCGTREVVRNDDDKRKIHATYPNVRVLPSDNGDGWPAAPLDSTWDTDKVDRILGRPYVPPSAGSGGGLSEAEVRDIAEAEASKVVAGTALTPPSAA